MTPTEITQAARLIRPILTSQLRLCQSCFLPTDTIDQALAALDRLVQAASTAEQRIAAIEWAASQATNDLVAELYQLRATQPEQVAAREP